MSLFFFLFILYYNNIKNATKMEYPGTHFTRPWRIALLTTFIMAFFIIAPLLVFYTSGYRYDFINGIVQETGSISIDILPKNSIAYLNNAKLKSKIPIRLKNIPPGKYKIKLTADGFYDWEKEIILENKHTAYIKEIKLIKKSEPIKIIDGQISNLYLSKNNNFLIYKKETKPNEFWLYNLATNQQNLILKETKKNDYQVNWSPTNNFASINSGDFSSIYIINPTAPEKTWNLAAEEKNKITNFHWNNSNQSEIFYSTKNQLVVIDHTTRQKSLIGKNDFLDWYVDKGQIWGLKNNSLDDYLLIITDAFGFSSNFAKLNNPQNDKEKKWEIIYASGKEILLKKVGFSEMIIATQDKQYNFFGEKFLLSGYNHWQIMWTPWELTTYSNQEAPYLLNRSGEQLHKVIVLDEYNTLGLIWADKMTALFPYYFVNHLLINKKINDAVADSQKRELYFSADINDQNGIWKMQY